MEVNEVHIGNIISNFLNAYDIKVDDFAERIYCSRSSAYRILKARHINTSLLLRISVALEHNFFQDVFF